MSFHYIRERYEREVWQDLSRRARGTNESNINIKNINNNNIEQRCVEEEQQQQVSFARFQRNTFGKNFSISPDRREMNGIVPNLPSQNVNKKNQETMGLLG